MNNLIFIYFLTVLFAIVLMFLIIEIPRIISRMLLPVFPDIHPVIEPDKVNEFLNIVSPIGYICLIAIIVLIVLGFKIRKTSMSSVGSFLLFLPTFSNFAWQMFFLAGLGILQVLWLPLETPGINILNFGYIINLPYLLIVYLLLFFFGPPYYPYSEFINAFNYGIIWLGLFIFVLGIIIWFQGRYKKRDIIDFSIYRYSRHPQYLGFLIWSYGVHVITLNIYGIEPMGYLGLEVSLPWLISALILIAIALNEEIDMKRKYHEKFLNYQAKAPFIFPLPKKIKSIILFPLSKIFKRDFPEKRKDIMLIILFYGGILITISFLFELLVGII